MTLFAFIILTCLILTPTAYATQTLFELHNKNDNLGKVVRQYLTAMDFAVMLVWLKIQHDRTSEIILMENMRRKFNDKGQKEKEGVNPSKCVDVAGKKFLCQIYSHYVLQNGDYKTRVTI